ncbi:MAG: hypothetical protein ACI835_002513 [Planctomycetota bacterium]|jgi:hypothetical protein
MNPRFELRKEATLVFSSKQILCGALSLANLFQV